MIDHTKVTDSQEELKRQTCIPFNFFNNRSWSDASFFDLAKNRRFHEISRLLPHASDSWLSVRRGDGTMSTSETLHALLMYRPNPAVVKALLERLVANQAVQPLLAVDAQGRIPLHIAVAKGCDFNVVRLLLSPLAINARDFQGRYPLHWSCIKTTSSRSLLDRKSLKNSIRVISKLIKYQPEVVSIRDAQGETPLDLAIRHSMGPLVIDLLRLASKSKAQASTVESSGDDSSGLDIPLEIFRNNLDDEDNDDDDISSVGFRGVSYHRSRFIRNFPPIDQFNFVHEVVEL